MLKEDAAGPWHKEWRGHPYALDLRGRPRKFGTPPYIYKNAATPKGVRTANACMEGKPSFGFPCFLVELFQNRFPRSFQSSANNQLVHQKSDFSPIRRQI